MINLGLKDLIIAIIIAIAGIYTYKKTEKVWAGILVAVLVSILAEAIDSNYISKK